MYRQGLGDCFLLQFCEDDRIICKVLIDCGTFDNNDSPQKLRAIAQNIIEEFDGKLDLLIVTHEHQDHVYGFLVAQDLWNKIKIGRYWLAWTEDPVNDLAKDIKRELSKKKQALHAALKMLAKVDSTTLSADQNKRLKGVKDIVQSELSFQGISGRKNVTQEAMDYIRQRAAKGNVEYLYPGKITTVPKLSEIKALVLGPPEDAAKMKRMHSKKEGVMYLDGMSATAATSLVNALIDAEAESSNPEKAFEEKYVYTKRDSNAADEITNLYEKPGEEWRKINDDWLYSADTLALHIGNYTNNTSLALAFYLSSGEVLLFPGDAQLGNWEGWLEHTFRLKDENTGKVNDLRAEDWLKRTIFYKASHHGSHNGTLKDAGLELMDSEKLVIMLPVDKRDPKTSQYGFPYKKLETRIVEKAKSRVIRLDDQKDGFLKQRPSELSVAEYKRFMKSVRFDESELYIEYQLTPNR